MSPTNAIKAEARRLGFSRAGILPVGPAVTHDFYRNWLAAGFGGEMGYLRGHSALKQHPAHLAPWARSLIVLALNYHRPWPTAPQDGMPRGRVSRYAWARDYHAVIREKLKSLGKFIETQATHPVRTRICVDSAPLMEREFAARAGLGWVGRHGNLIHWQEGSWFFLCELLVELELEFDAPPAAPRALAPRGNPPPWGPGSPPSWPESCGSCTACIDACPTQAIVADKTVDARRCISYLTIELQGPIPTQLRAGMGDWVFGCDVCQDVCPWNRKAPLGEAETFDPPQVERALPPLADWLALQEPEFRARFRGTPLWRAKRRGLLRNVAVVLGNLLATPPARGGAAQGQALAALQRALADPEPLVRGAAAWALGQAGGAAPLPELTQALAREDDPQVQAELAQACQKLRAGQAG